jgi:hypothetical protein
MTEPYGDSVAVVVGVSGGDDGLDDSWRGSDAPRGGVGGERRVDGTSGLSMGVKGRRSGAVGSVATRIRPIAMVVAEAVIMTCRSGTARDDNLALG